jgi:translation initiation factor IF-3
MKPESAQRIRGWTWLRLPPTPGPPWSSSWTTGSSSTNRVKEVKFRPGIEEHDYDFKTRHARRFLEEGNKVRLTMMFRGRQITHSELGLEVLERLKVDLGDIGKVESEPSFEGRVMFMVMAPLRAK